MKNIFTFLFLILLQINAFCIQTGPLKPNTALGTAYGGTGSSAAANTAGGVVVPSAAINTAGGAVVPSGAANSANGVALLNSSGNLIISGNIGIGSITPGQKLDVQGTIRASSGLSGLILSAHNTSTQSISSATWTQRTFTTVDNDSGGYWASNTYTPLVAGWYSVNYMDALATTTASGASTYFAIYKNGSLYSESEVPCNQDFSTIPTTGVVNSTIQMNGSTDYIQFFVFISSGASGATAQGTGYSYVSIQRVG